MESPSEILETKTIRAGKNTTDFADELQSLAHSIRN
jgi:hypothetical protein